MNGFWSSSRFWNFKRRSSGFLFGLINLFSIMALASCPPPGFATSKTEKFLRSSFFFNFFSIKYSWYCWICSVGFRRRAFDFSVDCFVFEGAAAAKSSMYISYFDCDSAPSIVTLWPYLDEMDRISVSSGSYGFSSLSCFGFFLNRRVRVRSVESMCSCSLLTITRFNLGSIFWWWIFRFCCSL